MANQKIKGIGFVHGYDPKSRELRNEVKVARPFKNPSGDERLSLPTFREYSAIWDTGATMTAISQRVIREMGLQPTSPPINCSTANSTRKASCYTIALWLPNQLVFPALPVIDGEFYDEDLLIGMDIISMGDFYVTRAGGPRFGFRTPSLGIGCL